MKLTERFPFNRYCLIIFPVLLTAVSICLSASMPFMSYASIVSIVETILLLY